MAQGTKRGIYFASDARGAWPAEAYLLGLEPNDQGKFHAKMNKFRDHDLQHRREFDSLADGLWEIMIFASRWIGFFAPGQRAFLAHGFEKRRSGRTPETEVNRARQIRTYVLGTLTK